jgi:hypothetical protein
MQKNIDVAGEKIDKKSESCQWSCNDFEKPTMLTDGLVSSGFVNVSMGGLRVNLRPETRISSSPKKALNANAGIGLSGISKTANPRNINNGVKNAKKRGKKTPRKVNAGIGLSGISKFLPKTDKKLVNSYLKGLIFFKNSLNSRIFSVIPPKALFLEDSIIAFRDLTDIPLEIPLFVSIHLLSAYLLKLNVSIEFKNQVIKPDIWGIILATSGAAKSYTESRFENSMNIDNVLNSGIVSAAAFIEELSKNNNSIWIKDEFAQLLKSMKNQPYMQELKEYLLKIYDNKTISRTTKKQGETTIEDPAITILGLNVYETFLKNIDAEDLIDGFAQRFNYTIAKPDSDRPPLSVPVYDTGKIEKIITGAWNKMPKPGENKIYHISKNAEKTFVNSFLELSGTASVPDSFIRRTLYKSLKYALIYHIILGKADKTKIDDTDIAWAIRLVSIHIEDVKTMLREYSFSELEKKVSRVEELKKEFAQKGRTLKPRDIIRHLNSIKTVSEATAILNIVVSD